MPDRYRQIGDDAQPVQGIERRVGCLLTAVEIAHVPLARVVVDLVMLSSPMRASSSQYRRQAVQDDLESSVRGTFAQIASRAIRRSNTSVVEFVDVGRLDVRRANSKRAALVPAVRHKRGEIHVPARRARVRLLHHYADHRRTVGRLATAVILYLFQASIIKPSPAVPRMQRAGSRAGPANVAPSVECPR